MPKGTRTELPPHPTEVHEALTYLHCEMVVNVDRSLIEGEEDKKALRRFIKGEKERPEYVQAVDSIRRYNIKQRRINIIPPNRNISAPNWFIQMEEKTINEEIKANAAEMQQQAAQLKRKYYSEDPNSRSITQTKNLKASLFASLEDPYKFICLAVVLTSGVDPRKKPNDTTITADEKIYFDLENQFFQLGRESGASISTKKLGTIIKLYSQDGPQMFFAGRYLEGYFEGVDKATNGKKNYDLEKSAEAINLMHKFAIALIGVKEDDVAWEKGGQICDFKDFLNPYIGNFYFHYTHGLYAAILAFSKDKGDLLTKYLTINAIINNDPSFEMYSLAHPSTVEDSSTPLIVKDFLMQIRKARIELDRLILQDSTAQEVLKDIRDYLGRYVDENGHMHVSEHPTITSVDNLACTLLFNPKNTFFREYLETCGLNNVRAIRKALATQNFRENYHIEDVSFIDIFLPDGRCLTIGMQSDLLEKHKNLIIPKLLTFYSNDQVADRDFYESSLPTSIKEDIVGFQSKDGGLYRVFYGITFATKKERNNHQLGEVLKMGFPTPLISEGSSLGEVNQYLVDLIKTNQSRYFVKRSVKVSLTEIESLSLQGFQEVEFRISDDKKDLIVKLNVAGISFQFILDSDYKVVIEGKNFESPQQIEKIRYVILKLLEIILCRKESSKYNLEDGSSSSDIDSDAIKSMQKAFAGRIAHLSFVKADCRASAAAKNRFELETGRSYEEAATLYKKQHYTEADKERPRDVTYVSEVEAKEEPGQTITTKAVNIASYVLAGKI